MNYSGFLGSYILNWTCIFWNPFLVYKKFLKMTWSIVEFCNIFFSFDCDLPRFISGPQIFLQISRMHLFFMVQNVNGFVLQRLRMINSYGCQYFKVQSKVVWRSKKNIMGANSPWQRPRDPCFRRSSRKQNDFSRMGRMN